MQALEVLADPRGVRERAIPVAQGGNLSERAHLAVLGVRAARHDRLVIVGHALLREDDANLADEWRRVDAEEGGHAIRLARVAEPSQPCAGFSHLPVVTSRSD